MLFCSQCGAQMPEGGNFCSVCGTPSRTAVPPPLASAAPGSVPHPLVAHTAFAQTAFAQTSDPLDYSIEGDNLQIARVRLRAGQEVYAEAGKMVYKTPNVSWDTRMTGATIGQKLLGALRRTVTGESLFVTYFRANGQGEVGFAGSYPGKVHAFDLAPGQSILAQRDAFLFAQPAVQLSVAFVKKLGAGFFGGEGFILERLTGPGLVFIHAGGDFVEFNLAPAESLQIETGCIVAFDDSVQYGIEFVGGIKTALFGGEGLFLATLTGPGRVILQSMTLQKMRRELAPTRKGGDEHGAIDALSGLLGGSED